MQNINHILFPIDFSERCCNVAPFVESMANRYKAKVTLLSATQPFYYAAMAEGPIAVDTEELLLDLKSRLDSSLVNQFAGLRVDRVAELGDPAQVITEFARTHDVGLIMMPTHGYGPFRSLLLGSVTAKVLHDAACPVWTAAHVEGPPKGDGTAYRKVLCAVDGTPHSVSLMKWAFEFSKDAGAELQFVHVIPGMEGLPSRQMDREFEADMRRDALQAIERLEESAGVKVPIRVAAGNVTERVREEALQHGADLLVIGRGVLHETLGRLRTHAHGIIRRSPCPVLSV